MRYAAYLSQSRHGIFYFRWPIPASLHPDRKRTDIKVSLGTRLPKLAQMLSRILVTAGQSMIISASVQAMRYNEIRQHVQEHFRGLLKGFRERVESGGPVEGHGLDALRTSRALAGEPLDNYLAMGGSGGSDALLAAFCEHRGITGELAPEVRERLLLELQKGHKAFLDKVLEFNSSFDDYTFEISDTNTAPDPLPSTQPAATSTSDECHDALSEVVSKYLDEGRRTDRWKPKTLLDKESSLKLLLEVVGDKLATAVSKPDARAVKDALLKLPKNRNKSEATKGLSLPDLLALNGVKTISTRTANSYLSHMQACMEWAEAQGYVSSNIFDGMKFPRKSNSGRSERKAFSPEQLKLMYLHLTENPFFLVKKDDHKWPTLIGMFTGARLNEIAQLETRDVREVDGILCFDLNDEGDKKSIKNASSRRIVPVHKRLLELGLLDLLQERQENGSTRLFPSLTFCPSNGYGRNVGRWFNEKFTPDLGIKEPGIVFHCFRHTMVTRLKLADAREGLIKSIVGHSSSDVTNSTYFTSGYSVEQLSREINKFDF
jgi:integrase